jgi:hypothetical protein
VIDQNGPERNRAPGVLRLRGWFAFAAVLLAMLVSPARAQQVMGVGEQALGPARGVLRMTLAPSFETFDERFLPNGDTEALGARLTTDAFGTGVLPALESVSDAIGLLAGTTFDPSLGSSRLRASTSINTFRIGAEYGLTHRISLMASVPIVRTRTELQLAVNGANGGNLGVNPALIDPDVAQLHQTALDEQLAAATALEGLLTACAAPGATDPRCPTVQANQAALQSLVTEASAAAEASAALYGPGAPFTPLDASATDAAIAARLDAIAASFASWTSLSLPAFPGGVFFGASTPIGSNDVQGLLTDPALGIGIDSLVARNTYGLGDIEVGVRLLLIDTPGRENRLSPRGAHLRAALVGGARVGTGSPPDADRPFDPGTGDGQHDVIGAAHVDLLFGGRFWATVTGRYVYQLEDRLTMRVAPRTTVLPPLEARAEVDRDLGDIVELEVAPRLVLGRYISIGARYAYRDKAEDRHERVSGESVPLDGIVYPASVLDSATAYTEQEAGIGFTFSTISANARGLAKLPIEVMYQHVETIAAEGAFLPKRSRDEVRVRLYLRLFGGA